MRFGVENKDVAIAGGHTAKFSPGSMGPNEFQQSNDAQGIKVEEASYDQLESKIHFESLW